MDEHEKDFMINEYVKEITELRTKLAERQQQLAEAQTENLKLLFGEDEHKTELCKKLAAAIQRANDAEGRVKELEEELSAVYKKIRDESSD